MSSPNGARKRLPVKPSEENLRKQAKRLAKTHAVQLADAQHRLAGEYGCRNWGELLHVVEVMNRGSDQLANVKRTVEPLPAAVRARDGAKVRAILESGEFTQHDLDAGLAHAAWYGGDAPDVLAVRKELFDLLLDHGADPDGQYGSAYGPIVLGTGECLTPDGLAWLLDAGCDVTFPPIDTKYGPAFALKSWIGTYARGDNAAKHRGIDLLMKHGAFVPHDLHPAVLAIHRGDAAGLRELLEKEPTLAQQRFCHEYGLGNIYLEGSTLLHCAAEFDEIDCCRVLFDFYVDINAKAEMIDGIGGQTAIFHVINTNWPSHLETLKFLVDRVGQWIDLSLKATWRTFDGPRTTAVTAIEYANEPGQPGRKNRDEEIALLNSIDRRGQIRRAAEGGDVATVTLMLDESPALLTGELWSAAVYRARSIELVRLLLDRGLDPNVSSAPRRAIDLAAYLGLADIAELLIARKADVIGRNKLGETPMDLLEAYEPRPIGDPAPRRLREALIQAGATYDIHAAVRAGDVAEVRGMLDTDPSLIRTAEPWDPLFTAARSGRLDVAKVRIERGATDDGTNAKGNTPLWFACQSPANSADRIAVAKLLLDAGANPRRECEDRSTPLHFAAWRGPIEMVELLIRHNAKEWQTDKDGKKPIDYARRGQAADKDRIVELLDRPVIRDPNFRAAVTAIHAGDLASLKKLLADHPTLARDRAIEPDCYSQGYFSNPKLLWFIADNPTLIDKMPTNSVELADAIIAAGAELADLTYTLELVMTSRPAREQKLQRPIMKLLIDRGAAVSDRAIDMTLGHWERDAIAALLEAGVPITAPIAAGMGRPTELAGLLPTATAEQRHSAFSLAVINRELTCARECLAAGADVNAFLRVHTHSLPIHQATINDDLPMMQLLVEFGTKLDVRDKLWNSTPLGWAIHEKKNAAEAYLRSIGATS